MIATETQGIYPLLGLLVEQILVVIKLRPEWTSYPMQVAKKSDQER